MLLTWRGLEKHHSRHSVNIVGEAWCRHEWECGGDIMQTRFANSPKMRNAESGFDLWNMLNTFKEYVWQPSTRREPLAIEWCSIRSPNEILRNYDQQTLGPEPCLLGPGRTLLIRHKIIIKKRIRVGVLRSSCADCCCLLVICLLFGCVCACFHIGLERNILKSWHSWTVFTFNNRRRYREHRLSKWEPIRASLDWNKTRKDLKHHIPYIDICET